LKHTDLSVKVKGVPRKSSFQDQRPAVRERLLAAADELFYAEGVNLIGIDRVIELAGVAKASLYDCFGSKDELIRSYLQRRHEVRQVRLNDWLARYATPRDKILGVFDLLSELVAQPEFRGCAFARASAEARPGSSARVVCDESRAWQLALFTDLLRQAGARDPESVAQQLRLIYDGASVSAHVDAAKSATSEVRGLAKMVLDRAIQ
jgi:AcrR family transcriptional regulator